MDPCPKMNIIFKNTNGSKYQISVNYGTTIDQLLNIYLKQMNEGNLYLYNKICFLYNATQLKQGNNTPIENFFRNSINPVVIANDISNLYPSYFPDRNTMHSHFEELYKKYKLFLDPQSKQPEPPKLKEYAVGEITVKFNKLGKIIKIKMDAECMVAELIDEFFKRTNTSQGIFIFNGGRLSPTDTWTLAEAGLENNSEIIVSEYKDK